MYKRRMTLSEWMQQNDLSDAAVAERLGKSRVTVSRYRRGNEIPSSDTIKTIVEITGGAVTANDLLGIPSEIAS